MAHHSFGGEVEASNTPAIRRFTLSRRFQLSRIVLISTRILDRGFVLFFYFTGGSNLAKMPVHKLLYVWHTVEFQQLQVLFHPPVQRHAHLPGTGVDLGIVDSRFIVKRILARGCVTLGEVQRVAMIVSCPVKPSILNHPVYFDYHRIHRPLPSLPTHRCITT